MYSSKYIEQDDQLECYQKELRKVKRKAHPFILIYMIFKGLFIILISFQLNTKLTLFKFFMIVTYVFNIRRIIIEICSLCTEFQMMELAELRLRYFFLTFLTNKKWRLSEDSHSQFTQAYTEKLEKIDLAQNKAYYETFLKKMEERLLQINRVYWGMNTFPLLFWLIFLSTLNYLIPDSSFIERFKLDWIFGLEPKTWSDWSIFSIELFQIHGVLISLYLEYMLLSFYLDCRNELVDMDSASIQDLLKVMTIKFRCMVDLRENNIKSDRQSHQLDLIFKKYLRALKWNPAVRDRTIENSTLPLSKRNSASSIRNDAKNSISIKPMEVISEEETSEVDEMKTDKIEKDQDSPQPEPVEVDSEEMESEESEEEEEEEDVADLVLPDKISKSKKPSKRFSVLKPVEDEEDDYETELKKFEEEENLQKFNFSKKNTLEGSQIDGLKKLVSRTITNSSKDHSVSYMTEMTTKEEMLILMFKNRYRYLFSKSLTAMQYAISRIVWIPLFYPLVSSINVLTICFFILFMVKTKARVRIFIEEARDNVNMVIYYLMSMWLQAFFHQQLYELRQADSSEHATFYRTFIDDPAMSALKDFILPVNRDTLTICFYWYFIICVSIACLPFFLWFTTLSLFRHYSHKTDTYHYYLLDSVRRRNLVIDYVKWKKSSWHFINFYYKTALTNPVEVFAMIIMVLFVLDWCSMFIPLLFMTMVIILMEHFRSDHIDNEASRQFNLSRQKRILELYRTVFWITMYFRHGIDFLGRLGFFQGYKENKEAFMENFSGTLFLLFTIATTYILSDLLVTEEFIRESFKIKTYRELKVNMASLCKAYEINENKVYYRVVQMIKKGHLDEISSNIIDSKIDFDCSAYLEEPDIKKIIESSFDKILRKNLGFWLSFKLKMTDSINSMLVKHVEKYIRQDMMILFDSFRIRNTHLIKPDEINLEDYFDDNMGFFFKLYDKVSRFYTLLAYEDEKTKKQFDTAAQAFMAENLSKLKRMPSEFPAKPLSTLGGHRASINQKKMNLKAATNVLFKAITSTTEYASTTNVDSYKVEFKKKGFIQCFYGKTKVILFNLKTSDRIFESSSFYEFSIFPIIYYLLNILNDRFDKVTAYVIILLHIFYGGLTNIIIVGLLVFTVFIEESPGRNTAWLLVYASLTLRMILKRFYFVYTDEYTAGFFLGHLTSNEDLLSIIIVVINIQALKYFSPINKACSDIENPGQAIVRMTLNDDFKAAIGRIIFPIMRKKESLNKYLCKLDLTEFEGVSPQDFRFVLVRQFIKNKLMLRDFKTNVMYQCQRLLKVLRYDYIKISSEQMDSFFFRNFSYNLRKKGGSYLTMVSCLFACIILFILMFFPTLGGIQAGVASFLFENTVTAFTVLNFTIYLSFFILHVYFDNTKTKDTAGLKDKDYKLKLIEGQFQDVTYEHAHKKPVAKLKNAVKLVQNSNNMMKQVKADFNLWTDNPLFYLFLSNIVLWIYMNISVYFWHSYHGNIKASQKEGLSQFICEPKDRIREPGESKVTQCRNYSERIESQIFYLLNTLYIILCMYQIRDGKELVISKITDYSSSFKQMFFSVYRMIPLMLEAECTFKFCATYTCLEFSDYILVKEIEQIMQKAKILQINRMETKTGKQLVRRSQIGLCCMVLSIVIGVLCLPIYIFYNDTSVNFYPIESANLTVDLYYDRKTPIMNLLSMTKLRENRILDKDLDADLIRVLSDKGVLRKYSFEQIRVA